MALIQHDCTTTYHDTNCLPLVKKDIDKGENWKSPRDNDNTVENFGLDHMKLPFPYKLHMLLCDMEATGHGHIISWVEGGKAFQIHDQKQFETLIQPRYFRQSKISSFIRQVNVQKL